MKKILFINPRLQEKSKMKMRPVGLAYIMTAVKNAGINFDYIDMYANNMTLEKFRKKVRRNKYDICALGCVVTGFRIVREISIVMRNLYPKIVIIVGNSVASSIPELLLNHTEVDIAVMGEGDIIIINLLLALSKGHPINKIKGIAFLDNNNFHINPRQELIPVLDTIGFPDWNLFNSSLYNEGFFVSKNKKCLPRRAFPINIARGCLYKCTFCYHVFIGERYRRYSEKAIIDEFKRLYYEFNASDIIFMDELSFPNISSIERFISEMQNLPFRIYWDAITRADLFRKKDIPLIKKMKALGCTSICFSIENGSQKILDAMGKMMNVNKIYEHVDSLRKGGIIPKTSVFFGYPQETPETIKKTFDLCERCELMPGYGYLQPLPGTPIYNWAIQNGYIKNEFEYLMQTGNRQIFHLNLTKMPTDEFIDIVDSYSYELAKKLNKVNMLHFYRDNYRDE